jgi:uncharacterized protein
MARQDLADPHLGGEQADGRVRRQRNGAAAAASQILTAQFGSTCPAGMMPLERVNRRRDSLFLDGRQKPGLPGLYLVAALFAAFAFVNLAVAYTFPPLTGRVVDSANIIPEAVSDRVTAKLASLEAESGIQLVVATVKSLEGDYIEHYANALFRTWGLGEKQKNNGVLLLVAPNDRKMRIEVGYGLEGTLTDVLSKIIITNAMPPRFKAGDFGGGIERGVDDIITVLTTDSSEWEKRPELRIVRQDSTLGNLAPWIALGLYLSIFFGLPILGFLGVIGAWHGFSGGLVRVGGSGRWSDSGFSGGGGSSGGRGSGGDFSGGGGSSGGGGASGSW